MSEERQKKRETREDEFKREMDDILRKMLKTPPKEQENSKKSPARK